MWDWIVNILFELLKLIQTFAVDWGLSIIILVVIIRLLLTPLMLKSTKSTARMQVLQPKMLEIQERYADDPQRQAEEMQKFYSENKFNPMAGCLPLLIQMPILFALFTLLRNLPQYFNDGTFSFFNILPDLTTTPSASFADGFMGLLPGRLYSRSSYRRRLSTRPRPMRRSASRTLRCRSRLPVARRSRVRTRRSSRDINLI